MTYPRIALSPKPLTHDDRMTGPAPVDVCLARIGAMKASRDDLETRGVHPIMLIAHEVAWISYWSPGRWPSGVDSLGYNRRALH